LAGQKLTKPYQLKSQAFRPTIETIISLRLIIDTSDRLLGIAGLMALVF